MRFQSKTVLWQEKPFKVTVSKAYNMHKNITTLSWSFIIIGMSN